MLDRLRSKFVDDWHEWRLYDWPRTILLVLLILAVFSALWQYFMPQVREINSTTFKRTREIHEVTKVQRVFVPCPQQGIQTLDKTEVAKKLELPWLQPPVAGAPVQPAPVAGDQKDLQVVATSDLPDSDNGYQVVDVFNTETGEVTPVVTEKESPWFDLENHGSLGAWYGYHNLTPASQLDVQWSFLRIKDAHLAVRGQANTASGLFGGAGLLYSW